jgi:hypothetical protein
MDLRTIERLAEDVWADDDEKLVPVSCVPCGRNGWIAIRPEVPTEVRCGRCRNISVTYIDTPAPALSNT